MKAIDQLVVGCCASQRSPIEALEPRCLFNAITAIEAMAAKMPQGVTLHRGVIWVIGTPQDDAVDVALRFDYPTAGAPLKVTVTLNGTTTAFLPRAVRAVAVFGGDGNDVVHTSVRSFLSGGAGNDSLYGSDGPDLVLGEDGDDLLRGWGGTDILIGGAGDDTIGQADFGAAGGEAGTDVMVGGDGNDTLFAGDGDDLVAGGKGDDFLEGGRGNDRVIGGAGVDTFGEDSRREELDRRRNETVEFGIGGFGSGNPIDGSIDNNWSGVVVTDG